MNAEFSSVTADGKAVRIDHSTGLSSYINSLLKSHENMENCYFFFDFDRLLTNGYELSGEGNKAPIEDRIRGGTKTVKSLCEIKKRGAKMFVITARSPKVQVVQQLIASLTTAQIELGQCFDHESKPIIFEETSKKYASNGCLFATGYHKELAIAHVLRDTKPTASKQVFFFDDAVTNSFSVLTTWKQLLTEEIIANVKMVSVWVDPFFEETEVESKPSMHPVHSESTDFNYHDYLLPQLKAFGITKEESEKRRQVYLSEEKRYNRKAPRTKVKPPDAKKMDNVEQKFSGLANLFGKKI